MPDGAAPDHHEVVAAIVLRAPHVLLCHRSANRAWYPDTWDLPGGHVERGETPQGALGREVHEELGIRVAVPAEPAFARLEGADFDCRIWIVTEWVGTPANRAPEEHDEVAWWSVPALTGLALAHPDYPALIRRARTWHPAPRSE